MGADVIIAGTRRIHSAVTPPAFPLNSLKCQMPNAIYLRVSDVHHHLATHAVMHCNTTFTHSLQSFWAKGESFWKKRKRWIWSILAWVSLGQCCRNSSRGNRSRIQIQSGREESKYEGGIQIERGEPTSLPSDCFKIKSHLLQASSESYKDYPQIR